MMMPLIQEKYRSRTLMEVWVAPDEGDPLFEEAKALVIETEKASASMIQRRLSVGFNRATRLMEELEAAGDWTS